MKRYNRESCGDYFCGEVEMKEDIEGDYVKFESIVKLLTIVNKISSLGAENIKINIIKRLIDEYKSL